MGGGGSGGRAAGGGKQQQRPPAAASRPCTLVGEGAGRVRGVGEAWGGRLQRGAGAGKPPGVHDRQRERHAETRGWPLLLAPVAIVVAVVGLAVPPAPSHAPPSPPSLVSLSAAALVQPPPPRPRSRRCSGAAAAAACRARASVASFWPIWRCLRSPLAAGVQGERKQRQTSQKLATQLRARARQASTAAAAAPERRRKRGRGGGAAPERRPTGTPATARGGPCEGAGGSDSELHDSDDDSYWGVALAWPSERSPACTAPRFPARGWVGGGAESERAPAHAQAPACAFQLHSRPSSAPVICCAPGVPSATRSYLQLTAITHTCVPQATARERVGGMM